jgi:hypothetical protein
VKLKTLAVLAVLVLCCSGAFAQGSYAFGFLSYTGGVEYCNYEQFTTSNPFGGSQPFFLQGIDNLTTACGLFYDATIEGVAVSVPSPKLSGVPGGLAGRDYVYADNLFDAFYLGFSQEQWMVITKTVPSTIQKNHWGWVGYASFGGFIFGDNYGFLTSTIPGKEAAIHGTTVGNLLKK